MTRRSVVVSATVVTEDDTKASKAAEVLARAVVGLALDDISASLNVGTVEDDEDDEDGGAS